MPVEKNNPEKPAMSALSRMIEESEVPDEESADQRENGGLALTIYLPDCNSLTVHVKETCNFRDVIQRTLLTHEKQGLQPPLLYNDIGAYELRIHEGKSLNLSSCYFLFQCEKFSYTDRASFINESSVLLSHEVIQY